jgi:GT2 family glycosyltransferase
MIVFDAGPHPEVSIVVVGLREARSLLSCLRSLADNVSGVAHEVIVVLNDPAPQLWADLHGAVRGARVVAFGANLGFGPAVNQGAAMASGRYIALLNDDCRIDPGWLEALVDLMARRPTCGVAGSCVLNDDGTLQEAGGVVWADGNTATVAEGEEPDLRHVERQVDYCGGESLLVRREVWELLGGFDEAYYPAYFEDVDLCFGAFQAGWEVWYTPGSVVRHARSASTTAPERGFFHQRARRLFVERWAGRLASQPPAGDVSAASRLAAERRPPPPPAAERRPPPPPATGRSPAEILGEPVVTPPAAGAGPGSADLELAAARREIALRLEYAAALEERITEQHGYSEWLYRHIDHITHLFEAEKQRLTAELETEKARARELEVALEASRQALSAEQGRLSHRVVERIAGVWFRVRKRD